MLYQKQLIWKGNNTFLKTSYLQGPLKLWKFLNKFKKLAKGNF